MNTLGERLRYARRKKGYTQESLAKSIGVSRGVIFNLEKNKTQPQAIVISAICLTLRINKDWLLHHTGEMEDAYEASQSAKILTELYETAKELSEEEQLYVLNSVKALKSLLDKRSTNDTLP